MALFCHWIRDEACFFVLTATAAILHSFRGSLAAMRQRHFPIAFLLLLTASSLFAQAEKVSIETWIDELQGDDLSRSILAAEMLGDRKADSAPAIPALIKALSDPRVDRSTNIGTGPWPSVARSAATALTRIGEPAVPALVAALEREMKESTRRLIIDSLGEIGRPAAKALPQLVKIVNDPADGLQFYAFDAWGRIHPPGPDFVKFASARLKDKSPFMRGLALQQLAEAGKDSGPAIDPIIQLLSDQESSYKAISLDFAYAYPLRADAAYALGRFGPVAATAIPRLKKMTIHDPDVTVRTVAAVALVRIDPLDPTSLWYLNWLLTNERSDGETLEAAADAAYDLGPLAKGLLPALVKLLQHEDDVRSSAFHAIAEIGGKNAIPLLQPALKDMDEFERERAEDVIKELQEK
jgi:HEAT repeat protein